jgi:transposase
MRLESRGLLSEETIRAVVQSSKTSLGVPLTTGEVEGLRDLAEDTLRALGAKQLAKERVRARRHESQTAERLAPFTGAVTAVVVAAAVGEVQDYPNVGAYLKALGLNLREKSSGESTGGMHITKRGSSMARQYLYFLALRVIKRDDVVRAWYEKKVQRDGGKKKKALTAVMRKLAKALWHVGRGAAFDARKLFDTRILKVVSTTSGM